MSQFVMGQVIEPRLLGHVLEIPTLTVLVALLFWGWLWGIIGAILSVRSKNKKTKTKTKTKTKNQNQNQKTKPNQTKNKKENYLT